MPKPSEPDRDDTPDPPAPDHHAAATVPTGDDGGRTGQSDADPAEQVTESYPVVAADGEAATEVIATEGLGGDSGPGPEPPQQPPERRFTAPGFDAGQTQVIRSVPDETTDAFQTRRATPGKAPPQLIPPRLARRLPAATSRSWGWVLALVLIILAVAVAAVLATVWLTQDRRQRVSQEDRVRDAIYSFDIAVQTGDLPALRGLTCGSARDNYVDYNEQAWGDTYRRVAAAKQYPVVASIDQVVVNGDHAEANVTAFMAYAPQVRSTRSFDLQYRDDQWKVCQSSTG